MANETVGKKDQKFGKYKLVELLGWGGEAEVWQAVNSSTQEIVAIRIITALDNTEDVRKHFDAEVQKLQELAHHPHIISLWDSGWDHGLPYLIMPFISNGSLAELLKERNDRDQLLPFNEAITYIKDTIDALIHVHAQNIIHRDVKPGNLLLGGKGILLNDWGIALDADTTRPLTRAAIGTPAYRPPEQEQGNPIFASDQYAMAITGCEILTGKRLNNGGREPLQRLYPQIAKVFIRASNADPSKRFPSMKDFSSAFNNAVVEEVLSGRTQPSSNDSPIFSLRGGPRPPRSKPSLFHWLMAGTIVLVLAASVLVALTLFHPASSSATNHAITANPSTILCLATDLPENGTEMASGQGINRGVQLALDQSTDPFITGYKGYHFAPLDTMDDSSENQGEAPDPTVGVENIQGLFPQSASCPNPIAIIGPVDSSQAIGEISVAAENHILLLSPSSTAPCLTQKNYAAPPTCIYNIMHPQGFVNTFGRLPDTDINQGDLLADFLLNPPAQGGLGAHNIVIVEDEEIYGSQVAQAAIDRFAQRGVTPLETDCVKPAAEFSVDPSCTFNPNAKPFSLEQVATLAAQIKSKNPDAIFFAGRNDRGASLLRQQLGNQIPFVGGSALVNEADRFFGALKSDAANMYATLPTLDPSTFSSGTSDEATFYSQYLSKFNSAPVAYSANGYDAANIIIQTIKNMIDEGQPITSANVAAAVLKNDLGKDDFVSITGDKIHFNQDGDNIGSHVYTLYQSKQQPQGSWEWNPIATQTVI